VRVATLLDQMVLTARFKPGASALGHHWVVTDADDRDVGRTRRAYPGGVAGRLLRRTAVATGFTGEDITTDLLGAGGRPVARLASKAKQKRVDVTRPDGSAVGSARRVEGEGLTLEQPDGRPAGAVPIGAGAPAPWPVLDAAGATVGAMVLTKAQRVAPMSLLIWSEFLICWSRCAISSGQCSVGSPTRSNTAW
jgi:hypothetical protein